MGGGFRLSIAVPVYNEEAVLPALLTRTLAILDEVSGGPHELILVDDGSRDGSLAVLRDAAAHDERITAVALSRNFGHQAALSAGLHYATGDAIVLMDADLQDPPEMIPAFLERHREGYDVVYAIRVRRKESWLLRASYALFYRLISLVAEVPLPRDAGDFCLMSRRVVEHLNAIPERHRYLRGMRAWVGFSQIGIPVERARRAGGKAKYNLRRLLRLAFDGIFSFSIAPLRAATLLGMFTIGVSMLAAGYSVYAKFFFGTSPAGFTWLAVSLAFFAGVQLLSLGVIGEYVGRIYEQVKLRPVYLVREVIDGKQTWNPRMPRPTETCTSSTGGGELAKR